VDLLTILLPNVSSNIIVIYLYNLPVFTRAEVRKNFKPAVDAALFHFIFQCTVHDVPMHNALSHCGG